MRQRNPLHLRVRMKGQREDLLQMIKHWVKQMTQAIHMGRQNQLLKLLQRRKSYPVQKFHLENPPLVHKVQRIHQRHPQRMNQVRSLKTLLVLLPHRRVTLNLL